MERPSYSRQIIEIIESSKPDAVFIPSDFFDIAGAAVVGMCLKRLMDDNKLIRVMRGVYAKPFKHTPSAENIAQAIARNNGWIIVPCGQTALYKSGINYTSPTEWTYVSDGAFISYEACGAHLRFKRTVAKNELSGVSWQTAVCIQALRAVGKNNVTRETIQKLAKYVKPNARWKLTEGTQRITTWVKEYIEEVYNELLDKPCSTNSDQTEGDKQATQTTKTTQTARISPPARTTQPTQLALTTQTMRTTQPARTSQPTQQLQTTQPARATQPTQSTQTMRTTQPTQSTQTTQPARTSQTAQPVRPMQTAQPARPMQMVQSTQTSQSTQSTKPAQTTQTTKTSKFKTKYKKPVSTFFGYNVRSKSEAIIAGLLHMSGLDYEYENEIFDSDGKSYQPDFTIRYKSRVFYWEHLGMLEEPSYVIKWENKEKGYTTKIPDILLITREDDNIGEQAGNLIKETFGIDLRQRPNKNSLSEYFTEIPYINPYVHADLIEDSKRIL